MLSGKVNLSYQNDRFFTILLLSGHEMRFTEVTTFPIKQMRSPSTTALKKVLFQGNSGDQL